MIPLRPNETVLWEGAPVPGLHQRSKAVFLMVFGLPFLALGVALFLFGLHRLTQAPTTSDAGLALFLTAFALPFGGLGAFLVFGPLIHARTAHRDIRYALTTRAAYVMRQGRFPSLKVYPILPYTALELEPGPRAGTVWLHARLERDSDGDLGTTKSGFENIAEAEKVFLMIRDLQDKAP
ncbi:hypothetical protein [Tabrizicola sp.]|uniref:hypothetical protein n=1 Tax=Tabrizicola sp. TaxID=2005166 RepID=UPI001A455E9A|nr:hypothetical protein [Tabrizicola sp.]MBL9073209.1 hypothetical protein [Tabrizicola sp.]